MSNLSDLDDIYDTTKSPAGKPCHPHQARVRRQYAKMANRRAVEGRNFQARKSKRPITLAKLNLPPAE
jgi:hypothetical protein